MKIYRFALILAGFAALFFGLQRLLTPKYMSGVYDGALIAEYYSETKNHEVIFIGDCEVYENFSPMTLFGEYGITSYIRGGAQQLIWQSYYLLEDTLRYETPEVVVFNVLAMQYGEPQSEAYNRLNLDGMTLSASKLNAVNASLTKGEDALSYIFPILRYHERWQELTPDDLRYFVSRKSAGHNGYLMRNEVKPVTIIPDGAKLANYDFAEVCRVYLDKMRVLCEENGIDFVLVKAPTIYPHWYDEWEAQIESYAETHGLLYVNFLEHIDDAGIDFAADTYDAGLHLNCSGAEKLSRYFGAILTEKFGLSDKRSEPAAAAEYAAKLRDYEAMKTAQRSEFETNGKAVTFTYSKS
ncbi:MAG: SGNH/GDSL hydrolase family protein [Oscillospiraceae bacterium]|jgi:hypothetical protein|nr:SGNH/GDSL hydrolase family protein [Oscillospiraceae bacterium]